MLLTMNKILVLIFLISAVDAGSQPLITEDRMYLKVSADVMKVEQDIYLPASAGMLPRYLISWQYDFLQGKLQAERSYTAGRASVYTSEKKYIYQSGQLIKDSMYTPAGTVFGSYTNYRYNENGRLVEATQISTTSGEMIRKDHFKYDSATSYEKISQFFGDDQQPTARYTSFYSDGNKIRVTYTGNFPSVNYAYDEKGFLIEKNNRRYYYKLDVRGNPVASVAIEKGMYKFEFMRLTYTDGAVTGSLTPDEAFIRQWSNSATK